jgi:C4-dicarboxylate transporter/malic acid transport protein
MGNVIKHFGPQWFGSTMGTGALIISMAMVSEKLNSTPILRISQIYLFLTLLMFAVYIVPWTIRFFKYPREVNQDLNHPIKGQFFPTMPISLIVIGIGLAKVGPTLFSVSSLRGPCTALFFAGTAGIYIFGFILVPIMHKSKEVELGHGVYAWYIPPVSHLIIPILGLILIARYYSGTFMGDVLFVISMASWGIGFFLFLFVGAVVYHRYAYGSLPGPRLAPTFLIGIAPTAIMTIALVKLAGAMGGVSFGLELSQVLPMIKLFTLIMWGFSVWWFILTAILFFYYIKTRGHPFVFGWWGYTFPMGAFAISGGAIGQIMDFPAFWFNLYIINFLLFFIWFVIFSLTVKLVKDRKAFVPD